MLTMQRYCYINTWQLFKGIAMTTEKPLWLELLADRTLSKHFWRLREIDVSWDNDQKFEFYTGCSTVEEQRASENGHHKVLQGIIDGFQKKQYNGLFICDTRIAISTGLEPKLIEATRHLMMFCALSRDIQSDDKRLGKSLDNFTLRDGQPYKFWIGGNAHRPFREPRFQKVLEVLDQNGIKAKITNHDPVDRPDHPAEVELSVSDNESLKNLRSCIKAVREKEGLAAAK